MLGEFMCETQSFLADTNFISSEWALYPTNKFTNISLALYNFALQAETLLLTPNLIYEEIVRRDIEMHGYVQRPCGRNTVTT